MQKYNNMIKTNIKSKVMGIRIILKNNIYILETVYEKEIQELYVFIN